MPAVSLLFTGVPVSDFEAATDWYVRLFGRAADIVVKSDEVMWRFSDSAWLYVVADADRAGRALVALRVPDLDQAIAEISGRGIEPGPIETVEEGGARKAPYTDGDGNLIAFIEVPE